MRKYILIINLIGFMMISPLETRAVGGISNSKIIVPSTDTVPKKHIEIEPFFSYTCSDDTEDSETYGFGSRFTLGILDNLEAGFNLNYLSIEDSDNDDSEYDFGNLETGLKYRIFDQSESSPFSLAYQGGVIFPTGSDEQPWIFEPAGLIITRIFSENLSSDMDFVFSFDEDDKITLVSNLGVGYFISEQFQPVIEASYTYENPDSVKNIPVVNGTIGFTAPVSKMLTIIFGITYDLYTENSDDEINISAAFTFLF